MLDNNAISAKSLEKYFKIDGKNLSSQYKNHLSEFHQWQQKEHAEDWILYPDNISPVLCLDEVSLSDGELYTVLTNAQAKTQKGSLISMIKGTKSIDIIKILNKMSESSRNNVRYISVDMANNMEKTAKEVFPRATVVTDRFHVAKLVNEAVQDIRIKHRWQAIDAENQEIQNAKNSGKKYKPKTFKNGDTPKQLLARSRYILFKSYTDLTPNQKIRADILFKHYPEIHHAYKLSMNFRNIYQIAKTKKEAEILFEQWFEKVEKHQIKAFNSVVKSINNHKETILNFFPDRITNALAENFNSKIKAFRSAFRGVRDLSFFLYRVALIFAHSPNNTD